MTQRGENRRSLGDRLRSLRKEFGIRGPHALAQLMNGKYSVSGILKRERGEIKIDLEYVKDLCKALQLRGKEREKLFGLAELHLSHFDAWKQAGRSTAQLHSDFLQRLKCAEWYAAYEPMLVPGLLQTQEYAYEIFRLFGHDDSSSREGSSSRNNMLTSLVNLQKSGNRTNPFVKTIIHESGLYELVGSPATMRQQIEKLLSLNDTLSVEIRVFPKSATVRVPTAFGFNLFDTTSATMETLGGAVHVSDVLTLEWLANVFSTIWDNSYTGQALNHVLNKALEFYQK